MRKAIYIGLLLVILVAGGAVYYVFNKPHRDVAGEEPAFSLSSDQLLAEYDKDTAVANKQYLDKVIQLQGKISEVITDQRGGTVIVLNDGKSTFGITCTMSVNSKDAASKLKKGEVVSLKGICTGGILDPDFGGVAVTMNKCELVE
ncbi:MAG: OB-fold protein [Cytophagaceae bacterium]